MSQIPGTTGEADATRRALAAIDAMAEAWARGADLTRLVATAMAHDDRESRIEGLVKLAWGEGAFAARRGLSVAEIEEFARAK